MKYDKSGGSMVTEEKTSNNMALALIVASSAVVLVAIAIILVVILLICRYRRAMKPVQDDMWAERNNIQIGEAVDDSEDGEAAHY